MATSRLTLSDPSCTVTYMNNTPIDPYTYDSYREDALAVATDNLAHEAYFDSLDRKIAETERAIEANPRDSKDLITLLWTLRTLRWGNEDALDDPRFDDYFEKFQQGYVTCAEWINDDDDLPEEDWVDAAIENDCYDFCQEGWNELQHLDPAQCGHDFYLTRNGHGAGFWDRGLGLVGTILTELSRPYGETEY